MAIQHQAHRKGENFPVASWLVPQKARRAIVAFYDFARGADNIADHASMESADKEAALLALKHALSEHYKNQMPPWAEEYYTVIYSGLLRPIHGEQLLEAFIQDTRKQRYRTFEELLAYCRLSAVPVGRAVLDACREDQADIEASDAICIALQLINHLQDIREDYAQLDRIYLPQEWLSQHQVAESDLAAFQASQGVRTVMDRVLEYVESQLPLMDRLPKTIRSRRVRMEILFIIQLIRALVKALRRRDPMAEKVTLSTPHYIQCFICAVVRGPLWV